MTDSLSRKKALNPTESFIVQAPAGSGKTELLTQRYLNLLAHAKNAPEEIIAITFTRKAASEMRERVTHSIQFAINNPEPSEPHKKATWALAKKVIEIDLKKEWNIINNPNRLRILTIDSLAAMISSQVPLLSGFGAKPSICEDAKTHYQLAVENSFEQAKKQPIIYESLKILLLHLENNADQLQKLLIELLSKREQWLPRLISQDKEEFRLILENSLANIVDETIDHVDSLFDKTILKNISIVTNEPKDLNDWQAIANLLLTSTGDFRKTVDKRCGFPSESSGKTPEEKARLKNNKEKMLSILDSVASNNELKEALNNVLTCPPAVYSDSQWKIIDALITVLPILAAELNVIFHQYATIDFTELTLGALRALNHNDNPTDLALYLDYQIQHILVDEFQDTSVMQFELLLALTQGWEKNDGRTLFLVGDPMQSIYRFRNAEVGLFLRTQQQGIGNITLTPLTLTLNFRSEPEIIDWVNHTFNKVFPLHADITAGAVPYTAAYHPSKKSSGLNNIELFLTENRKAEGEKIADIIRKIKQRHSTETIAILVRSRKHLDAIFPALRNKQIPFNAVQIEPLANQFFIQDLLSLTQALLHLNHRIAWLSLLRSPICGLSLNDLLILSQNHHEKTIWQNIISAFNNEKLSAHAKDILLRVTPILHHSLKNQGEQNVSSWLKGTWLALGGPATAANESDLKQAEIFFNLVESLNNDFSLDLLRDKLSQLYADVENHDSNSVSVMTIHKSKGLEFDHIILPGLSRLSPVDQSDLLMWLERPTESGELDLILAPIKANAEKIDPVHHYLRRLEKIKLDHENARLFYVASTRAKKALYFTSDIHFNSDGNPKINNNSFLSLYKLAHKQTILAASEKIKPNEMVEEENRIIPDQTLFRLSPNIPQLGMTSESKSIIRGERNESMDLNRAENLTSQTPRKLGQIIHQLLAEIGSKKEFDLNKRIMALLKLFYLPESESKKNHHVIFNAITNTLNDPKGKWILSTHVDSHFEYQITVNHNNKIKQYIIDRTFIFENTRWIIDFKTSAPTDSQSKNDFIKEQYDLYKNQLKNYAHAFSLMEKKPIQLGLYFPLCQLWYDVSIKTAELSVNDLGE